MTASLPRWKEYHTPTTLLHALELLRAHGPRARVIAGGTDLILDMGSEEERGPDILVDVTHIEGMDAIHARDEHIVIGASVTHAQIEKSGLLQEHAACLVESCGVVGGPQVRNVATIGGNVAHALPAADGTIGLLALDAEAEVSFLAGSQVERRWQPLLSLFAGPGRNTLEPGQLVSAFRFARRGECEASAFDRIMRPQGVALPILGLAAWLRVASDGRRVDAARIAIGPAGPIPFRASDAEALLCAGRPFDAALLEEAIAAAGAQVRLRTSRHRASSDYRREMLAVLLRRVLVRAFQRAGGSDGPTQ